MAIHLVTPRQPASLSPSNRVVVRARASSETNQLVLRVRSEPPATEPQRLASGQWLLDREVEQADLWISRADGAPFPAGSTCEFLVVATGPDEDIARIPNVDLVGKQEAMVASLLREPGRVVVSVPHVIPSYHTPTAQAAVALARQILGVDKLGANARDVVVDVDGSASMRHLAGSGALEDLVEVLFGVTRVIDPDHVMPYDVLVEAGDPLPGSAGVGDASTESEQARPGARVANTILTMEQASTRFAAVRSSAHRPPANGIRFVVTDGPPHDLDELERLHREGQPQHLVILCAPEVESAWSLTPALPVSFVPPHHPVSREIVESLLQEFLPDSAAQPR